MGSKIAFKARFLGRELTYVYEIIEFVPRQKLMMSMSDGPFPMERIYIWDAVDENTNCMALCNRGNPSGFLKLLSPSLAMRRE